MCAPWNRRVPLDGGVAGGHRSNRRNLVGLPPELRARAATGCSAISASPTRCSRRCCFAFTRYGAALSPTSRAYLSHALADPAAARLAGGGGAGRPPAAAGRCGRRLRTRARIMRLRISTNESTHVRRTLDVCLEPADAPASAWRPPPHAEPALPFTVQDMVRLERISDVAAAPDGKRVACHAAHHRHGGQQGPHQHLAARHRQARRDAAASHRRCGEFQCRRMERRRTLSFTFCRIAAARFRCGGSARPHRPTRRYARADAPQVTNLPLDVGSFRVSPKADRILVSVEVFFGLRGLRLHQAAAGHGRARPGHAASCTASCSCGTGTPGATAAARSSSSIAARTTRRAARR